MKGNNTIKRINQRDIAFMETIGRVCHIPCSYLDLNDSGLTITTNRINTFQNIGWVEKVQFEDNEYYRTTKEGRQIINDLTGINCYYSNSPLHDMELLNRYLDINLEMRTSWKTESELKEQFLDYIDEMRKDGNYEMANELEDEYNNGKISVPDGAYYSFESSGYVAVEIVTSHYTQEMIEAKENYCEVMGIEYELERVY